MNPSLKRYLRYFLLRLFITAAALLLVAVALHRRQWATGPFMAKVSTDVAPALAMVLLTGLMVYNATRPRAEEDLAARRVRHVRIGLVLFVFNLVMLRSWIEAAWLDWLTAIAVLLAFVVPPVMRRYGNQ